LQLRRRFTRDARRHEVGSEARDLNR
jgi:hypothetical protein